jgi:hypothetical protein
MALLSLVLILGLVATAQMKYPPKVIVVFKGEKNPTFDESKYPDLTFYYTPGLVLEESIENTKENETVKAALSVSGLAMGENFTKFNGTPVIFSEVIMSGSYLFDKNVTVTGNLADLKTVTTNARKNLQGGWDNESFKDICKDYVKKGKTTKLSKKKLKKSWWDQQWHLSDYIAFPIPKDFEIENTSGEKISISSLISENSLTLVHFMYLNKNFDLNQGEESGADKTGGEYAGDVVSTMAADKQISYLSSMENIIFGYRVPQ